MCALFPDFPVVQHDYLVSALDCRKPMGHDDRRAIAHDTFNRLLNQLLSFGID